VLLRSGTDGTVRRSIVTPRCVCRGPVSFCAVPKPPAPKPPPAGSLHHSLTLVLFRLIGTRLLGQTSACRLVYASESTRAPAELVSEDSRARRRPLAGSLHRKPVDRHDTRTRALVPEISRLALQRTLLVRRCVTPQGGRVASARSINCACAAVADGVADALDILAHRDRIRDQVVFPLKGMRSVVSDEQPSSRPTRAISRSLILVAL
jgi:hypothetical protein